MFFLLRDNFSDLLFVYSHIPKTGGTSIRGGGSNYKGAFSVVDSCRIIKDNWKHKFSFTVHRNPFERFLSAYSDFKDNRNFKLELEDVINKLDKFDYNKAINDLGSFEHHVLPQSDPLWGADKMNHKLCHENLRNELRDLFRNYDIKNPLLPMHRKSKSNHYVLTKQQKSKLYAFYKKDFEDLNYYTV
jgi:hypothetical protein